MKSRRAKHADPYALKWSHPGDCQMKRQNKKHLNPAEQRELAEDIFGGKYSVDMWNEINAFRKHFKFGDGSVHELAWEALYTIGCRLQEFESFVRRRLNELKLVQLRLRLDDMRLVFGLTDKEIKALRRSHNARKGKK